MIKGVGCSVRGVGKRDVRAEAPSRSANSLLKSRIRFLYPSLPITSLRTDGPGKLLIDGEQVS
jgi:hypothetical protein